jgi:non-specific serine/threonine protein kinase
MIGETVSHYKILEKLGEGGMGVVYRAEDTRLKRTVALKFLRAHALGDELVERFTREAQAAAALDHPNICTVHEIDRHRETLFLSMAYIEGVNLKHKIEDAPLQIDEALRIGVQIAKGLEAAHKRGIVHRDIKSANIMVTPDGHVKIMDFGLAKSAGGTEISKTTTMGTVAYMSPEQARGDHVDHHTDIWSWGVCFYEMLTGQLPFHGDFDAVIIYKILNQEPTPISELRHDLPKALQRIVQQAMAKRPADRYPDAAKLLSHLQRSDETPSTPLPPSALAPHQNSVAVLPFTDMSPSRDQEYFCDGIAEEITSALVKVGGLRVAARTSSFCFKDKTADIREIGRQLNVDTVLEGSVRKAANRLRVTAQLIKVADGYHIWSDKYDREFKDVFSIQDEIAQNIVRSLKLELTDTEKRAMGKPPTINAEAYDFYLRGRKYFYQSKRKSIEFAVEMFSRAIEKDPRYGLAHAGLSDCYSYLYMYFHHDDQNLRCAEDASQKALQLDPRLAEAHAARGLAVSLSKRYAEAAKEFDTAIRFNPQSFEAYYFYARICFAQGKMEKAAQLYELAAKVSPLDYQAPNLLAFTYRTLGQWEKAKATYDRALELAENHLQLNPDDSRAWNLGAHALIDLEQHEKGLEWAKRAVSIDPDDPYIIYSLACVYSRLGQVEDGVDALVNSIDAGFAHKEWIENDSDLESIRSHPRYVSLLKTLD